MATIGATALSDFPGLIQAVGDFDMFTPDKDPHLEHDFGAIPWENDKTFWKIEYYDQESQYWHDPLDAACRRVMTIMLSSEY